MSEFPVSDGGDLPDLDGLHDPGLLPDLSPTRKPLHYPTAADHRCSDTPMLILQALEGLPDSGVIDAVRLSLAACPPCVGALDVEIRFKIAMAQQITDKAPPGLQLRISETLQRVDLGDIDITDL